LQQCDARAGRLTAFAAQMIEEETPVLLAVSKLLRR
jgi:hypothetical protein